MFNDFKIKFNCKRLKNLLSKRAGVNHECSINTATKMIKLAN